MTNVVSLLPKLKVTVIDCPVETWRDDASREAFNQLVQLKLDGYGSEYSHGALPLDGVDWVATHIMTSAVERDGTLKPLMSLRIATLDRCEEYNMPFPALALANSSGAELHRKSVEKTLERCRENKVRIGHSSSWTVLKSVRENKIMSNLLKEVVAAVHFSYEEDHGIQEMFCAGVTRFKADIYQQALGFELLQLDGKVLSPFAQKSLNGEFVNMLLQRTPSPLATECVQKHRDLWLNRTVFSDARHLPKEQQPQAQLKAA